MNIHVQKKKEKSIFTFPLCTVPVPKHITKSDEAQSCIKAQSKCKNRYNAAVSHNNVSAAVSS